MKRYLSLMLCLFPLLCGEAFAQAEIHYNEPPDVRRPKLDAQLAAAKTDEERFYLLSEAAMVNYETDHFDKAEKYAKEILTLATKYPQDWHYGMIIHRGKLVLGRLALRGGDTEKARFYLLDSVKFSDPQEMTNLIFNMTLAKELLEKKESEIVLKFLTQCEIFWEDGKEMLKAWREQIKEGKTPNFGVFLHI